MALVILIACFSASCSEVGIAYVCATAPGGFSFMLGSQNPHCFRCPRSNITLAYAIIASELRNTVPLQSPVLQFSFNVGHAVHPDVVILLLGTLSPKVDLNVFANLRKTN